MQSTLYFLKCSFDVKIAYYSKEIMQMGVTGDHLRATMQLPTYIFKRISCILVT